MVALILRSSMRSKQGKLQLKLFLVQTVTEATTVGKERDWDVLMIEGLGSGVDINVDDGGGELQFGAYQFQNSLRLLAKVAAATSVEKYVYHRRSRRK